MKVRNANCILCSYKGDMNIKSVISDKDVLVCPNCSLEFLYPKPTFEEIKLLYSKEYYKSWGMEDGENSEVANMKKRTFYNMLKKISPYKKNGNLLDIGSASGFLLEEAEKLGFSPYGIEISEYSSDIAKKKFGYDRIYNGILENAPFEDNFFDVITMCDLLEHVEDPIKVLKLANRFLKKSSSTESGYILISTPNTNSFTSKIMNSKWTQYKLEHLYYFNKKTIKMLSDLTGFEIILMRPYWKNMTLKYMNFQFSVYKLFPVTQVLNLLDLIPLINKIHFNILLGEFLIILRKV